MSHFPNWSPFHTTEWAHAFFVGASSVLYFGTVSLLGFAFGCDGCRMLPFENLENVLLSFYLMFDKPGSCAGLCMGEGGSEEGLWMDIQGISYFTSLYYLEMRVSFCNYEDKHKRKT